MSFFASLYYVCIALAHFCALPILFLLTFKSKYKISLKKRFFFPSFVKKKANLYWFHVCSFGEAKALYPVIESLQNLLKNGEEILITTTTQSGFKLAQISYPRCLVYYLPFETFIPFWMYNLSLKCFVVFEAEFWFMPLFCAKKKGAKTFLFNGRISSFKKYQRFSFFYQRLFKYLDKVFCQQEQDKERFLALGARDVEVCGNLKLSIKPLISQKYTPPPQKIWIIASTHQKKGVFEEVLILQAILKVLPKDIYNTPRILFVPRHIDRCSEIRQNLNKILESNHLPPLVLASKMGIEKSLQSPFVLVDLMGELNNLYPLAELVILGGSFLDKIGGHNPIEPAFFGAKLISGPYIFHQKALFGAVKNFVICDISELDHVLLELEKIPAARIIQEVDTSKVIQAFQNILGIKSTYENISRL